jgi:hypothetical protein
MNLNKLNVFKLTLSQKLLNELESLEKLRLNVSNFILNKDWLIGFSEAEGCFSGSEKVFQLSQHSSDYALILAIKNYLGHGNIRNIKREDGRLETVLTISSKSVIQDKIIPLFNGNLFTLKKREQFKNWIIKYFPHVVIIDNVQAFPSSSWVVGFVDGDGSFYPLIHKANDYKCGFQVQLIFEIAQTLSETPILDIIGKNYFGDTHKWGKSCSVQHLKISSLKANNELVVPFFDLNGLLSRKQIDFLIWKEMLDLINQKKHLHVEGVESIRQLREMQHHYRKALTPLAE